MKNITLTFAIIFAFTSLKSQQNIVPNWSFEDTLDCTINTGKILKCYPWFSPNFGTPDYFTPYWNYGCGAWLNDPVVGFQQPRTGQAYAGIFCWEYNGQREYYEVKLSDSLTATKNYRISFWASLANGASYQVDRLGAYISNDSLLSSLPYNFSVIPQVQSTQGVLMIDTMNWFEIKGNYVALGGEQFITIGNFYDNANTLVDSIYGIQPNFYAGYYFIDDVSVVEDTSLAIDEHVYSNCDVKVSAISESEVVLKSKCELKKITIYNLCGQIVLNYQFEGSTNKIEIPITLPNGIYILKSDNKMNTTNVSKLYINH